jgi:hypothetical protein
MGSITRPRMRKLTMLWSFFIAKAMLRSTFLPTNYEYVYDCSTYNKVFSTRAASISRPWRDCQAGAAQTFGRCFEAFADVFHGRRRSEYSTAPRNGSVHVRPR